MSFSPREYGKEVTGRLVVQTEEMQWLYEVRGTRPQYKVPVGKARVDTHHGPEVLDALPDAPPPPPSADELQLRRELQQLRRENKRLKTAARGGNWTVTSTYYTGDNGTVASRQSRRSQASTRPSHRARHA